MILRFFKQNRIMQVAGEGICEKNKTIRKRSNAGKIAPCPPRHYPSVSSSSFFETLPLARTGAVPRARDPLLPRTRSMPPRPLSPRQTAPIHPPARHRMPENMRRRRRRRRRSAVEIKSTNASIFTSFALEKRKKNKQRKFSMEKLHGTLGSWYWGLGADKHVTIFWKRQSR